MNKSFVLNGSQSIKDLMAKEEYRDALIGAYDFTTFRFGNNQLPVLMTHDGNEVFNIDGDFKIDRHCTLNKSMLMTDTDAYSALSAEELEDKIRGSRELLESRYSELQAMADDVQAELLYLLMLMRIRKRLDIRPITHTGNEWKQVQINQYHSAWDRSNMVYAMRYSIEKDHEWDRSTQTMEESGICILNWSVSVQSPALERSFAIAEQTKKFHSEEAMQKYLAGRIKAYDKYFREVSPPVPLDFLEHFTYAGQLLPGYTVSDR